MLGPWKPLLEGDLARRARLAVHEVAEALRNPRADWLNSVARGRFETLAAHDPWATLLYAYLAETEERPEDDALSERMLDQSVDNLADTAKQPGLFGGFTGIGWMVAHLTDGSDPDA